MKTKKWKEKTILNLYDVVTLKPAVATGKNRIRNLKVIAEVVQIKRVLEKYESSEKIEIFIRNDYRHRNKEFISRVAPLFLEPQYLEDYHSFPRW